MTLPGLPLGLESRFLLLAPLLLLGPAALLDRGGLALGPCRRIGSLTLHGFPLGLESRFLLPAALFLAPLLLLGPAALLDRGGLAPGALRPRRLRCRGGLGELAGLLLFAH